MKFTIVILSVLFQVLLLQAEDKIDDWDFNQTKEYSSKQSRTLLSKGIKGVMMSAPMMKRSVGLSAGGAKDANNFYENLKRGYLPKIESITYEGVFYEHRFLLPKQECKELFCPKLEGSVRKNFFNDKRDYFLSIGLDSNIDVADFKRKRLNLIVVLDISGSMSSPFSSYYYDGEKKESDDRSKMEIATHSIASLLDHLKDGDSFGVVLFDNSAYLAKPLRRVADTDIKAIKKHIVELKAQGGTNWSAGYKRALEEFDKVKDNSEIENRIIFITDAMPNRGELGKDRLFGMIRDASKRGIFTTTIGVGVDFNNDLVEYISKTRGANYLSIHNAKEFKKRLDDEFDYLVTPLVYDLKLELAGDNFKVKKVYGTATDQNSKSIIDVNTLFASSSDDEGVKGGVILAKLKKLNDDKIVRLKLSFKDRDLKLHTLYKEYRFDKGLYYDSNSIQKAILLSDYVTLMRNFLVDARRSCNDKIALPSFSILKDRAFCHPIIPQEFKTWERRSCKLKVSEGYKKLFHLFYREFKRQKEFLRDDSLARELNGIKLILDQKNEQKVDQKVDDWQMR